MKTIIMLTILLTGFNSFSQGTSQCDQFIGQYLEDTGFVIEDVALQIDGRGSAVIKKRVVTHQRFSEDRIDWVPVSLKKNDAIGIKTKMYNHKPWDGLVKIFSDNKDRVTGVQYLRYIENDPSRTIFGSEFLFSYDDNGNCIPAERQIVSFDELGFRSARRPIRAEVIEAEYKIPKKLASPEPELNPTKEFMEGYQINSEFMRKVEYNSYFERLEGPDGQRYRIEFLKKIKERANHPAKPRRVSK
ncbi:MAG: hypothetical protein AB7F59_10285 [Bdellovibrionales bacterium]